MKYSKNWWKLFSILGLLILTLTATFQTAQAAKVKIAHATWVGYGPLYLAQKKGFFKRNGVDVELIKMEDPKLRFAAMRAGRIDVSATTIDTIPLYLKRPNELKYFLALDDSKGGDGVIAKKEIKSIADLKGKSVAVSLGSVTEFYLSVLLLKAGMQQSDVKMVNMTASDAGSAFVTGRVDAAVTYEPWLSKGAKSKNGHILVDSSSTPGLITDVLAAESAWISKHGVEVSAIVKSWNEAVEYYRAHPDESIQIMAKGVGGWLKDAKEYKSTLTGVALFGSKENKEFFGSAENPGRIYETVAHAIKIWADQGKVQVKANAQGLVEDKFVNQ